MPWNASIEIMGMRLAMCNKQVSPTICDKGERQAFYQGHRSATLLPLDHMVALQKWSALPHLKPSRKMSYVDSTRHLCSSTLIVHQTHSTGTLLNTCTCSLVKCFVLQVT